MDTKMNVSRASGYELQNPPTVFFPLKQRGLSHYPKVPVFRADPRRGRLHWDLEILADYWFVSDRMKSVIERVDPAAFAFLRCKVQFPDGTDAPVRWLCDVVRVVDALDEEKSTIRIRTSTDGSKVYNFSGDVNLIFKEDAVGPHHVFRMMYYESTTICDEKIKLACKAANLTGLHFGAQRRRKEKVTAFALAHRGHLHHARGDFDLAIEAFSDAIRLGTADRDLDRFFYSRAETYFQKKEFDQAIADYSETIRLRQEGAVEHLIAAKGHMIAHSGLAVAYHARGSAYLKKGDLDRATSDIEMAKRLGYKKRLGYSEPVP